MIKQRVLVAMCLLVLAGSLRFYKLGDWPFAGDETTTLAKESSLFGDKHIQEDSQVSRLPRMIPLSYLIHHVGYEWFGRDEFGSRAILAILGTISIPIIFLLLAPLLGQPTAIATSLLIALWPEHLCHSQVNRFYMIAAFFAFLCLLGRTTW